MMINPFFDPSRSVYERAQRDLKREQRRRERKLANRPRIDGARECARRRRQMAKQKAKEQRA